MSLDNVTPGNKIPESFNVIIEIPMNADPVKYEVDKATGAIFVDRFMSTAMHYPTNYGYVPKTISGDGDPVDVLVITPVPLIPGATIGDILTVDLPRPRDRIALAKNAQYANYRQAVIDFLYTRQKHVEKAA